MVRCQSSSMLIDNLLDLFEETFERIQIQIDGDQLRECLAARRLFDRLIFFLFLFFLLHSLPTKRGPGRSTRLLTDTRPSRRSLSIRGIPGAAFSRIRARFLRRLLHLLHPSFVGRKFVGGGALLAFLGGILVTGPVLAVILASGAGDVHATRCLLVGSLQLVSNVDLDDEGVLEFRSVLQPLLL